MSNSIRSSSLNKRKQNQQDQSKKQTGKKQKTQKEVKIKGEATNIMNNLLFSFGYKSSDEIPTKV